MIKSELAQVVAEKNNLKLDVAEHVLNTIFDEIIEALAKGNRVELRGFGSFDVRARDPRVGRNPRTGDAVPVAKKRVAHYKTGKQLHKRLNENG